MADQRPEIYRRLRAPEPTPADELCSCPPATPLKLMSAGGIGYNPIHCLRCNLEVPPESIDGLDTQLVDAVADWYGTYGAIDALELASGEYEAWARAELLDPSSPANIEGRDVAARLDELRRCYFWFWQPAGDDDFQPRSTCPVCTKTLTDYPSRVGPLLLCERCTIALPGE